MYHNATLGAKVQILVDLI